MKKLLHLLDRLKANRWCPSYWGVHSSAMWNNIQFQNWETCVDTRQVRAYVLICFLDNQRRAYASKGDCNWEKQVVIPLTEEEITTYKVGYLSIYTYPFMLGPAVSVQGPIDPVILDFFQGYRVTFGLIYPLFWCIIYLIKFFSIKFEGMSFIIDHLIKLHIPRIYHRGLKKLQCWSPKFLLNSINEEKNQGWMNQLVRVKTPNLIHADWISLPKEWNIYKST